MCRIARELGKRWGLTPAESELAVLLAEGKTVSEIAVATERSKNTLYWHLKRIYHKLSISRQVDLVRVVLSIEREHGTGSSQWGD